jgi:hypothetical protein
MRAVRFVPFLFESDVLLSPNFKSTLAAELKMKAMRFVMIQQLTK